MIEGYRGTDPKNTGCVPHGIGMRKPKKKAVEQLNKAEEIPLPPPAAPEPEPPPSPSGLA